MNLRKLFIAASMVALAACNTTTQESAKKAAVSVEALTTTTDVTRVTIQTTAGATAIAETAMTGSAGKYAYQHVNLTPGTYDFLFTAYKQVAGFGKFTMTNAVAVGDNVTVTQGTNTATFTARESLQNPLTPFTSFNLGGSGAWGMVTLAGVVAGDVVNLNGVAFTAVAGVPLNNEFTVGASDYATAVNLANAVNASTTLGVPHSAGIQYYLAATQVGAASVRLVAAPGPTGNTVAMYAANAHFTFDAFANHPFAPIPANTAGNLAAVITTNTVTKAFVTTSAAGNVVTVTAKTAGALTTAIVLASSGANITLTAFAGAANQMVGQTPVTGQVFSADLTTVLSVAILDTTTRSLLETGPTINAFSAPATLPFTAAPAARANATAYVVGDVRSANNSVYICTVAGTSGAAAPASWGTGTVVDGTVTWRYVSASPNAWTNAGLTFSAQILTTAADSWTWTVTPTCPSGKGKVATAIDAAYGATATGVGAAGLTLGPVTYYFVDSALETCTIKLQVDKLRNIGPGGAPVVIGSDFKIFQVVVSPMAGQGGLVANVNYVQAPLISTALVDSMEGTCGIIPAACDPTVAYEGGVGAGECARFGAPVIAAPVAPVVTLNDGRCSLNKVGCIVAAPPAWVGGTAYLAGDRVVNNHNTYVCATAGTSALSGGPAGTGAAIGDGTATWNYMTPESGCASVTYGGKTYAQTCEAGTENGRCNLDYTRCFTTPATWLPATAYAVNDRALNCTALGVCNIYVATVAGTSAAAGGPTGTVAGIADGTVTWDYATGPTGCLDFVRPTATPTVAWAATTAYSVGAFVSNGGNVYYCTTAGTSGATGPAGTGTAIVDGTARWNYYYQQAVTQSCVAESFEDVCVPESKACGFTDPLNPIAASTVNACTAGRYDGANQVTLNYVLGSPIANVAAYLNVVSCDNLDGTPTAIQANTSLLSSTNSQAKFLVSLPTNGLVPANLPYWCTFNARVVQSVSSTLTGAADMADEQQIQVYVTPQ